MRKLKVLNVLTCKFVVTPNSMSFCQVLTVKDLSFHILYLKQICINGVDNFNEGFVREF